MFSRGHKRVPSNRPSPLRIILLPASRVLICLPLSTRRNSTPRVHRVLKSPVRKYIVRVGSFGAGRRKTPKVHKFPTRYNIPVLDLLARDYCYYLHTTRSDRNDQNIISYGRCKVYSAQHLTSNTSLTDYNIILLQ